MEEVVGFVFRAEPEAGPEVGQIVDSEGNAVTAERLQSMLAQAAPVGRTPATSDDTEAEAEPETSSNGRSRRQRTTRPKKKQPAAEQTDEAADAKSDEPTEDGPQAGGSGTATATATRRRRTAPKLKGTEKSERRLTFSGPDEDGGVHRETEVDGKVVEDGATDSDPYRGTPRNAPCPCGSGKKYKMCHGANH